jgi:hypothetical protein
MTGAAAARPFGGIPILPGLPSFLDIGPGSLLGQLGAAGAAMQDADPHGYGPLIMAITAPGM